MKTTENHSLYLIEKEDTFSPDPLNENARKIDQALQALDAAQGAEAQARQEADGALDQRLAAIEGLTIVTGSYTGSASKRSFNLGFYPKFVLFGGLSSGFITRDSDEPLNSKTAAAVMTSDGFQLSGDRLNQSSGYYHYLAIG